MKLNGIIGKGTGKLGSSVFAISGGEQVVREYNPVVSNPNTEAQIAQRAKLKLMSQLAAVLAPALGFAKKGLVSARNQFVSKNIGLCTFVNEEADVNLANIQLTPSNIAIPGLTLASAGEGVLEVKLEGAAPLDVKRVAYFVYRHNSADQLEYVASKIVTEAGEGRIFTTTFNNMSGDLVVYAYGIKDNSISATIAYENYVANASAFDASLSVVSMFRTAAYGLTATVGSRVGM